MKKLSLLFLTLIISISFVNAQWYEQTITWNTGEVVSDTLITTGTDVSDWFQIAEGSFGNYKYPESLSFLVWGDMGAAADSTKGAFTLELTNDKTYIYSYGALVSLGVGVADPKIASVLKTDMPLYKFGRITVTGALEAGDSSKFGVQMTRDFSNY